ncbi:MAG: uL15 family ribosomal protein, partial [Clostridia bacterium]|nr:uL15 family ribosomal protein [Clostridia bacterium]
FNSKKKFTEVDYASLLTSEGLTYMQKLGYDYMVKDSVTYEEVAILNDEWAEKIVKTELIKDPERYIYDEVTLKELEDNFEDGSVVSLEAMRQKGLVKINSNHITVKASESLSKKFIVEGNVIEPKAVAMIYIAGGEATRLIGE